MDRRAATGLSTFFSAGGPAQKLGILLLGLCLILSGPVLTGCGSAGTNGGDGSDSVGNGDGDGEGGGSVSAPAAPSGLEAAPDSHAVRLDWNAVDEADTYDVYRSTSSGVDASEDPLESGLSSAEYTDTGAENGTEYVYAVTAVAEEGGETAESDPSGEASALPFAPPRGLEGTSQDSEVVLNWAAAEGAASYNVYRSTEPTSGAEGEPLAEEVPDPSYTDTGAENGTKYYYRVTSVNANGAESSASSEVGKTPFSDPPGQP